MSYQFIDGYGSVLTADSSIISGSGTSAVIRPIVNIGSIVGLSITQAPGSVSGVGLFNVNHVGNGSILTVSLGSIATAPSPASVSGVGLFNVNHVGNGSILTVIPGSVATVPSPGSVSGVGLFNVNHTGNGSVQTVWLSPSIVGTYAEDAGHTSADRGIFTLGVRNDAVASFASANLDYTPIGNDSAGRILIKPFAPEESRVYGIGSTVNIGPSSLIAAAGAGLRNYVTDIFIANTGSVATLVSFRDIDASVIGKTIAPAGGGSNIIHMATPMRTHALNSQIEYTAATATSILHISAFGFKAP